MQSSSDGTDIRVLGPAMGMSTTSKGYYIQSLSSGKFMRSTVVVVPATLPPLLPQLPEPEVDDYAPSFLPEDEAEDHLQDDVEEPMKICPDHVVEELHADQGGAEVQVHVMNPRQQVVPTPGELRLADGSRPRRLHGKQHVDLLPPSVSKLLWTTTGGSGLDSVVDHDFQATNNFKNRKFEGIWITFNNFVFFNIMSYVGFGEKKPKLETMT